MTFSTLVTSRWFVGSSSAALLIIATGLTLDMRVSTAMILLAFASSLGMGIAALGLRPPSPDVVPIRQSLQTKDDRS